MSSKRRLRRKACEGKRRYATVAEARAAIRSRVLNTYYCKYCGGVHNGHPPRGIRPGVNARRR